MKTTTRPSCLVLSLIAVTSVLKGQITYVDAVEGLNGNTFATGGSLTDTSWISNFDDSTTVNDQWTKRSALGGNGDTIFQASHALPDEMPELTTQLTGLADGTYDIWVFYWDQITQDTQNWTVSTGLVSGSLTSFSSPDEPVVTNATTSNVVNTAALDFTTEIVKVEGDGLRNLFGVKVGKATVSASSPTIEIYLDNYLGSASLNRTIYDGVGYELTSKISYVDAVPGTGGNTLATGGTADDLAWLIDPGSVTYSDTQWQKRTFGTGGDLFQALPNGDPTSIPELTTSISGLPAGSYEVWAFFQDNVGDTTSPFQDWVISAGLESGSLTTFHALGQGPIDDATSQGVWDTINLALDPSVSTVEGTGTGERHLFGVNLGVATVSGGSDINVFVDMNLPGGATSRRVWYDGVGYAPTGASIVTSITIASLALVDGGLWEAELQAPANTTYQILSSPNLTFAPGAAIEGFTQNDIQDPGTISGTNNNLITTDAQGIAKIRFSLGGTPANFIRAEIAPQ